MKKSLLYLMLMALFPVISYAQWSSDPAVNNAVIALSGEQAIPKIGTCPNGNSYIASFSNESGNYDVRMQLLDAQGNNLWADNGILVSDNPQMTWLTDWDMTADIANYAILTFQDIRTDGNNNVVAYRIGPDGTFAWGPDGISLSNSTAFDVSPKVCVTAAGNAVFAWQADSVIIMQKISPDGTLLWGDNGITMSSTSVYSWPQLMPVGTDDVIMKYFEDTGPSYSPTRHVFAQRYDANGAAVWGSPAVISNVGGISAWTQIFPMINDGSDGFYIAWHDDRDNNNLADVYVQHIGSDGSDLFPANGVEASTMGGRQHFYPQLALPPGSSDVYVFWNEMDIDQNNRGIYGQKLSSTGTRLWPTTGKVFIEISPLNVYPVAARNSPTDVVLFYEEYFDAVNSQIKAMRVDGNGDYVWSPSFKTLCSVNSQKIHTVVNDFANNQWISAWEDDRSGNTDIYAQNIQLNGDLGPYDPQIGTIEGTVTLNGGTGDVTQVEVTAGSITVNPDATGFYTMDVESGTMDVTASLPGYYPETVSNVVVVTNETTSGVDFTLNPIPTGFIQGNVVLNGGTGIITDVVVTAGYNSVNPDTDGNYSVEVPIGTYDVIATLSGYVPDTVTGVIVLDGQTTSGVNLELNLIPTTGFIQGTVTLENNAGDVTQAVVVAGIFSTNPDASGHYTLEATAGTYDVSASLDGFLTQVESNIVVLVSQTTVGVDFFLPLAPDVGYIDGYVTLTNGTGDVTQTLVSAGGQFVNPGPSGHYFLSLPAGTYTVTADHPMTDADSITGISVEIGNTVSNVDFELPIVYRNLICMAKDTYGTILNDINIEFTGPDGTYTGLITGDSLVFEDMYDGNYSGSAWMTGGEPVTASMDLDQNNQYLVFVFDLTGIKDPSGIGKESLNVFPNPFSS